LHHSVLKGVPGKVAFLIETALKLDKPSVSKLDEWINKPTAREGFTPLHFASFKGNLDAINTLLKFGADKDARTATGLNMLHLGA
jgi:palmitoyltransferase ZDHHC13/17